MTSSFDTPEQTMVNQTRLTLMEGDLPATPEVAGVMSAVRTAFKAGVAYRDKPVFDAPTLVRNYANNRSERLRFLVEQALTNDFHSGIIIEAYEKGRSEVNG